MVYLFDDDDNIIKHSDSDSDPEDKFHAAGNVVDSMSYPADEQDSGNIIDNTPYDADEVFAADVNENSDVRSQSDDENDDIQLVVVGRSALSNPPTRICFAVFTRQFGICEGENVRVV